MGASRSGSRGRRWRLTSAAPSLTSRRPQYLVGAALLAGPRWLRGSVRLMSPGIEHPSAWALARAGARTTSSWRLSNGTVRRYDQQTKAWRSYRAGPLRDAGWRELRWSQPTSTATASTRLTRVAMDQKMRSRTARTTPYGSDTSIRPRDVRSRRGPDGRRPGPGDCDG